MKNSSLLKFSAITRRGFKAQHSAIFMRQIHEAATAGFNANNADLYHKGRINYSKETINKIASLIRNYTPINTYKDPVHVVELGAGTGKLTTPLVNYARAPPESDDFEAFKNLKYTATEPSDFLNYLREHAPVDIDVQFGTGAAIPVEGSSVDAIISAQSFHWMATETAVKECHRALKANKPLIMVWNVVDYDKCPWFKLILDDVIQPRYDATHTPHFRSGEWMKVFDSPSSTAELFAPLERWEGSSSQTGKFHTVYDRVFNMSVMAVLPDNEKQEVRNYIRNVLATHPDLEKERASGDITVPIKTEIAWACALKEEVLNSEV